MIRKLRKTTKRRSAPSPSSRKHAGAKVKAKKSAESSKLARPKSQQPAKAEQVDAVDLLIAGNTKALALPLDPAWYGGVKFNLQLILRLGAVVDQFPVADDTEPGPVFHA
jgi:hypothetical protein